jgi:hypothetical protein
MLDQKTCEILKLDGVVMCLICSVEEIDEVRYEILSLR